MPSSSPRRWFYVDDGRRHGPVALDEILDRLLNNHLTAETPVWHAGLTGWVKANTIPEIAAELPPPVPTAALPTPSEDPADVDPAIAAALVPLPEASELQADPAEAFEGRHHRHRRHRSRGAEPRWDLLVIVAVALVVLLLVLWRTFRQADAIPSGIIGLASPLTRGW